MDGRRVVFEGLTEGLVQDQAFSVWVSELFGDPAGIEDHGRYAVYPLAAGVDTAALAQNIRTATERGEPRNLVCVLLPQRGTSYQTDQLIAGPAYVTGQRLEAAASVADVPLSASQEDVEHNHQRWLTEAGPRYLRELNERFGDTYE